MLRGPVSIEKFNMQNYNILAGLCSSVDWFEPYLVGNTEERFLYHFEGSFYKNLSCESRGSPFGITRLIEDDHFLKDPHIYGK